MDKVLIDSGPLIALFDRDDKYHQASLNFIRQNRNPLVTSLATLTEVLHLLNFSHAAQQGFLTWVAAGAIQIEPISATDLSNIARLMARYADLPMDFADACLVLLAEKLNINTVASIDRDFDVYRLPNKRPFTVLIKR